MSIITLEMNIVAIISAYKKTRMENRTPRKRSVLIKWHRPITASDFK